MLKIMSTQNLTGVEITGMAEDIKSLHDAIKKVLKSEKGYYHVLKFYNKIKTTFRNEIQNEEKNVTYCFKILWPELLFIVFSMEELLYNNRKRRFNKKIPYEYVIINYLKELVLNELKNIIGEEKYRKEEKKYNEKIFYRNKKMILRCCPYQWINVMNVNYIKAQTSERIEILSQWVNWLLDMERCSKYRIIQSEIWNYARINNIKEKDVLVADMEYNGEINW